MNPPIRVVGIETSCDETGIGIVSGGGEILANVVASSLELHRPFGGVIPEIAARAHVETLWEVFGRSLEQAHLRPEEIDAIAVTQGPGLPGALLIGLAFAKGLALSLERPLIPVDHLAAHLYAGEMTDQKLETPYVGLVVSGGHTLLCVVHAECRFELLGETKDDAVGEAFDKVARLLGLGYPGGPEIDRLSEEGHVGKVTFPRAGAKQALDFSFSGLKTAVYHYVKRQAKEVAPACSVVSSDTEPKREEPPGADGDGPQPTPARRESTEPGRATHAGAPITKAGTANPVRASIADIAASFQETAVETLVAKTLKACQRTAMRRVCVGGGVACNRRLRSRFAEEALSKKLEVVFPPPELCIDNGAMVAGLGLRLLERGRVAPLSITSDPSLCLA